MAHYVIPYTDGLGILERGNDFLYVIDYNLCKVYQTGKQFLIMPINPFGSALIVDSDTEIHEFEKMQYFPDGNEQKSLCYQNKELIETKDFFELKEIQELSLLNHIKVSKSKYAPEVSINNADSFHSFLRKTSTLKRFKLPFIFLLGDHIIQHFESESLKLGIVQEKLCLNPCRSFVILDSVANEYLDIEYRVYGKWGYQQFDYIARSFEIFKKNIQPPLDDYYRIF